MSLIKSAAVVGGNTLLSRILGFARDMLVAHTLGTGMAADAWVAAFRFPNLFRRIFGEGAMNAAFLPVYAKLRREENDAQAQLFARHVQAIAVPTVLALQIVFALLMPWLLIWMTPGFVDNANPDKFALTLKLTLICLPYPFFLFVMALHGAILNAHHRFGVAAFVPCLLNVILSLGILLPYVYPAAAAVPAVERLAYASWVAGIVQSLLIWGQLRRLGISLAWVRPAMTDGVRRFFRLLVPALISGGITQINIMIGSIIASYQAGAMAYLYYTDRVYQLPLGIIGVALGTVLLPRIAKHVADQQPEALNTLMNRALVLMLVLSVPCSVMLLMAAEPIVALLFQRGAFSSSDTLQTARSLAVYGAGLPAFMLIKIFAPVYFARENARVPTLFAALSTCVDIALALLLARALGFGHVGIALATILAAWFNAFQLWRGLSKKQHFAVNETLKSASWRIAVSACAMVAVLYVYPFSVNDAWWLFGVHSVIATLAYAGTAYLLGVHKIVQMRG